MTPEETLMPLGFTETEALTYCELLRAGPSTGYRIAQGIGKAQANTYKTLSTLAQKSAVIDDGGEPRLFRAVPPEQLIKSLEARLSEQAASARSALTQLEPHAPEDRIYQIRSVDQIWARCEQMIGSAREVILFDMFPQIEDIASPMLEKAVRKGVTVEGVIYDDEMARVRTYSTTRSRAAENILRRWPGSEFRLVVDANQQLLSLLSHDMTKVLHGLWSESVYLSVMQHYALAGEIRLHKLHEAELAPHLTIAGDHPPGLRTMLASTDES